MSVFPCRSFCLRLLVLQRSLVLVRPVILVVGLNPDPELSRSLSDIDLSTVEGVNSLFTHSSDGLTWRHSTTSWFSAPVQSIRTLCVGDERPFAAHLPRELITDDTAEWRSCICISKYMIKKRYPDDTSILLAAILRRGAQRNPQLVLQRENGSPIRIGKS